MHVIDEEIAEIVRFAIKDKLIHLADENHRVFFNCYHNKITICDRPLTEISFELKLPKSLRSYFKELLLEIPFLTRLQFTIPNTYSAAYEYLRHAEAHTFNSFVEKQVREISESLAFQLLVTEISASVRDWEDLNEIYSNL